MRRAFWLCLIIAGLTAIPVSDAEAESYRISIKGGGGYATETKLLLTFSQVPYSMYGSGKSDANDGEIRVAVSSDDNFYRDFNDAGRVNLTKFAGYQVFVRLNSKWGSDRDSYMKLEVEVPEGCIIKYKELDHYQDDLEYVHIDRIDHGGEYRKKPYSPVEKFRYYKIMVKGGGGYHTESKIHLMFSRPAVYMRGFGKSDAIDEKIRAGISEDDAKYYELVGKGEIDLTEFAEKNVYLWLNSKWGTEPDTYVELYVKVTPDTKIKWESLDRHKDDLDYVKIVEMSSMPSD